MVRQDLLFPSQSFEQHLYVCNYECKCVSVHEAIRVYSTKLDVALDRRTNMCDH